MVHVLTTGRLRLELLPPAHAKALHSFWTSPGGRRFLRDDEVVAIQRTREIVEWSVRLFEAHDCRLWGVREVASGWLVGLAGFWHFREPPELELLFGIAEDAWGRAYASEAARAVVDYGHAELGMTTIRASTDAANAASQRVLARIGLARTDRATVAGLDTVFYEHRSGSG
jgi:[ribosomal protein S5]-alanine N-acetyltransferase